MKLCAVGHNRGHLDGCADEDCRGCRAVLAADGLEVCGWHADRVLEALSGATGLVALWDDVEDALTLKARQGGTGGRSQPLPVDMDAAEWRQRVRVSLVGWMLILEEEFGVTIPSQRDRRNGQ